MEEADQESFRSFMAACLPRLLRFGYLLTGNEDQARELVQDALARTFAVWWRVRRVEYPDAYVRRAMLNLHLNRRRRLHKEYQLADLAGPPVDVADFGGGVDERLTMWRLLELLPSRQRAVIVLRFYEDRSEAEIARLLRCRPGTVKSQSVKALKTLRKAIEPSSETPEEVHQP